MPDDRFRELLDRFPTFVGVFRGPDLVLEYANEAFRAFGGEEVQLGRTAAELDAAVLRDGPQWAHEMAEARRSGRAHRAGAVPARVRDPATGESVERFFDLCLLPWPAGDAVVLHAAEVTDLVRSQSAAAEAERLFGTLLQSGVVGITITGEEELVDANDAFLEMVGYTREDLQSGLSWTELTAPESAADDERAMRALRERGVAPPYEKEYLRRDGTRVPVLLSGARVQREPLRVVATVYDLTERRRAEQEIRRLLERERDARYAAELAHARVGRLQQITGTLSASLSADEIARAAVNRAVEDLSAGAGSLARVHGNEIDVLHAVGYDPAVLDGWRRLPLSAPAALATAARENRTVLLDGGATAVAEPHLGSADGFAGTAVVPLVVGGRVLGVLGVSFDERRRLLDEDLEYLRALAQQAAVALDRAHLFENRAYVARRLQGGLLPERLAEIPGVQAAVRYSSIAGQGDVGGDFYDLFDAAPGRWALTVGDVCGKGTEAAVVTGLARHTLRAVAWMRDDPRSVLGALNDALRRHSADPSFCTVLCGFATRAGHDLAITLAAGGHPFPFVLRAGGELESLRVRGTMLGVADDPQLEEATVVLAPGDALIAFTDGVFDARAADGERYGEARLRDAVAAAAGLDADGIADAIDGAVAAHAPGPPADDRAILVLRVAS